VSLETDGTVRELEKAQTSDGRKVAPASDDFRHDYGSGVDVNANPVDESFRAPDRSDLITIHVDGWDGTGEVAVHWQDPDGNDVTSRTADDNDAYATDGTTDVWAEVSVASPWFRIEIEDASGAQNTVNYTVYAR
jgi:hypothetical protein